MTSHNALKCETGLILAKAAAMHINANLESSCLARPLLPRVLQRVENVSHTVSCDHELSPRRELNLLGERLVLQGSCAFLALFMVNVCLYSVRLSRCLVF